MKLTRKKVSNFKHYDITIETEAEHKFLRGLFGSGIGTQKGNSSDFNEELDGDFYNLIAGITSP